MHNFLQNPLSQILHSQADIAVGTTNASVNWFVYMIETEGKTLYTGIATDVERRFDEHLQTHLGNSRLGAKYFRGRRPLRIVHVEPCASHSAAASREYAIKQLSASAKRRLVQGMISP